MAYQSLFEADVGIGVGLYYQGSLKTLIKSTQAMLAEDPKPSLRLNAARIIRAFLDRKVEHINEDLWNFVENDLREAIEIGLGIYRMDAHAGERLAALQESVLDGADPEFLNKIVVQYGDHETQKATEPQRSMATAERLMSRFSGKPLMFTAIGHGGVAAGIDVFLMYCDKAGSGDSRFHVVRFSRRKMDDLMPRLSAADISYIKGKMDGRNLVVFDEDIYCGNTLIQAKRDFQGILHPAGGVVVAANYSSRISDLENKINTGLETPLFD